MDKNFKGTKEEYIEFRKRYNEANKRYYSKPKVKEKKKLYSKKYRKENKEKISNYGYKLRERPETKERLKKWKIDNREHIKLQAKEWREINRERKNKIDRIYYHKKRKDKIFVEKEIKRLERFRKENPDAVKKYNKKYYTSQKGVINYTKHNHKRLALIKERPCDLTIEKIKKIHRRDKICVYCSMDKRLELDHIIPLKLGGNSLFINFVLACKKCNTSKSGRDVFEWCKLKDIEVPKIVIELLEKQYEIQTRH